MIERVMALYQAGNGQDRRAGFGPSRRMLVARFDVLLNYALQVLSPSKNSILGLVLAG
jgi:hypothetical protein